MPPLAVVWTRPVSLSPARAAGRPSMNDFTWMSRTATLISVKSGFLRGFRSWQDTKLIMGCWYVLVDISGQICITFPHTIADILMFFWWQFTGPAPDCWCWESWLLQYEDNWTTDSQAVSLLKSKKNCEMITMLLFSEPCFLFKVHDMSEHRVKINIHDIFGGIY